MQPTQQPTQLQAVCERHERPAIPGDCPAALRTLIERCWAPGQQQRPPFTYIADQLRQLVVEVSYGLLSSLNQAFLLLSVRLHPQPCKTRLAFSEPDLNGLSPPTSLCSLPRSDPSECNQ